MIELHGHRKDLPAAGRRAGPRRSRDVSLRIERGDFVAIVGTSGSGKSTLMNVLGLLDRPDTGRYLLDGEDVAGLDVDGQARLRNRRIGFVFQAFHLLPRTTALENVELPLALLRTATTSRASAGARSSRSGSATASTISPRSCPAGSSSAWRSPAPSSTSRTCCSPTSRRATSTRRSAAEVLAVFDGARTARGRTIVLVTHDPAVAAHCARVARIEGGRSSRSKSGGRPPRERRREPRAPRPQQLHGTWAATSCAAPS